MPDIAIPEPTSSHILWGGTVEVHCFGKPQNWSLSGETGLEADMRNPGIRYRMQQLAEKFGCKKIYAPNPSKFNGEIVHPEDFKMSWTDTPVLRGPFADGVVLAEPNTAFAVSSADCPTLVMYDRKSGFVSAAHAGRDSLIDRLHFETSQPLREDCVVSSMLKKMHSPTSNLEAFIACGIGPYSYRHPIDDTSGGKWNQKLIDHVLQCWGKRCVPNLLWGGLWLAEIIRSKLLGYGLRHESIGNDGICTFDNRVRDGNPLWHSNRRGDTTRNLVLVIRR